ncbi:hypothetical protein R6Q57_029601 [Mikania cordata]
MCLHLFLAYRRKVEDQRATHNCWAYKIGNQYRNNDDGEPFGTAGRSIQSAIENSGLDRGMFRVHFHYPLHKKINIFVTSSEKNIERLVLLLRHFGGIKLGTGGLVRAYGGVAAKCLKNAPTGFIKSQVSNLLPLISLKTIGWRAMTQPSLA